MGGNWKETNSENKLGIAIFSYDSENEKHLNFDVGDSLNLISETKGWFFGSNVSNPDQKGLIPKTYIHVNKSIEFQGYYYANELPIVREMSMTLKSWGHVWKQKFMNSLTKEEKIELKELESFIYNLVDARRIFTSSKLTVDEMKEMQKKITKQIDIGNAKLGLDLVIRNEEGSPIDPLKTSAINMYKMHKQATKMIDEEKSLQNHGNSQQRKGSSYNLYVNVKNFVCRIGGHAQILLSLYDAKDNLFISEHYMMRCGQQGMMKDLDSFNNLRVIYTDLSEKDIQSEKIFLVCQIIRIGIMDIREPNTRKQTKELKRPFGVASINVSEVLQGKVDLDEEKQYFIPFLQSGENDLMDTMIKKSITTKDINHKGQGFWVTMRNLLGNSQQLYKDYPHLVTNSTFFARKMGFPDVIMPADTRNDLYVTLKQGEFKKGGNKMADKNIQVTVNLCDENGNIINGHICEGSEKTNCYESVIYYHEDKPKWFETVKVEIPSNCNSGLHLRFSMKHRSTTEAKDKSEKPFGLSYIRLMNDDGTTLSDQDHDLLVYKIDNKKFEELTNSYLKLPSTSKEQQNFSTPSPSSFKFPPNTPLSLCGNDFFQISTTICSTKLTHKVELMSLLKGRDNEENLEKLLNDFLEVDGEEAVKFLGDILDALFLILIEHSKNLKTDKLVFNALVFLLGIVSDHKYNQFESILDLYIKESFSSTLSYTKLIIVLTSYLEEITDITKAQHVMKSMKTLEFIFKFIVYSRILFASLNENKGQQQFDILLSQFFNSMNNLLRNCDDVSTGLCAIFLSSLPNIIPHLLLVTKPFELCNLIVEIQKNIPTNKLILEKMNSINRLVHSQLFKFIECRRVILPTILDQVEKLLSRHVEALENNKFKKNFETDAKHFKELEICFKILSDILDYLFICDKTTKFEDIKIISVKILRLVIKTVIFIDKTLKIVGLCVSVMISIFRQMCEKNFIFYIKNFETIFDLLDCLMEILMIFEQLIINNIFPSDWLEIIMMQNGVFLHALNYFSKTIIEKYTRPFNYQVWQRFFLTTRSFVTQKFLQLEEFEEIKKNKILFFYRDMRKEAISIVISMWNSLNLQKIQFIPSMVGPFLQMTLVRNNDLRIIGIPLFFDMMKIECQYNLSIGKKNHFYKFEKKFICCVDELITSGFGDQQFQKLFYQIIKSEIEKDNCLVPDGMNFTNTTCQLFHLLFQYRTVAKEDNPDNKMICLVRLLEFYREKNREELYIRCLNKLSSLHLECKNHTEAAHALLLHAQMLRWSDEELPDMLLSNQFSEQRTHRNLKENLYYKSIDYFVEGKMWEKGIELCKELATQYEIEIFDYFQLSAILRKEAELFDSIMNDIRAEPEYFRVSYYGTGFHPFLQNRSFIYRGKDYERLSDFASRMLNQFLDAQLLKSLNTPDPALLKQPKKYIQINKVTPIMELNSHLASKRLSDQILRYYKTNEVDQFTFSRKKNESTNEISSMWVEKTILKTDQPFPGILHWFPVVHEETFDVSPLQLAYETIEDTNNKIIIIKEKQKNDPHFKVTTLGMLLQGTLDAAVNGGIANYRIFYTEEYEKNHSTEKEKNLIEKLKTSTAFQMKVLREALDLHNKIVPESMKPLHNHLEIRYLQMIQSLNKEYGIEIIMEDENRNSSTSNKSFSIKNKMEASPQQNNSSITVPYNNLLRAKVSTEEEKMKNENQNSESVGKSFLARISNSKIISFNDDKDRRITGIRNSNNQINRVSKQSIMVAKQPNSDSEEPPPLPVKSFHSSD